MPRLRIKPYEEHLRECRLRGDLIQVDIIIGPNMDVNMYFTSGQFNNTRGNGCIIIGKPFQSHEAKHFFLNRVVNLWNTRNVIECRNLLFNRSKPDLINISLLTPN